MLTTTTENFPLSFSLSFACEKEQKDNVVFFFHCLKVILTAYHVIISCNSAPQKEIPRSNNQRKDH